MERSLIETTNDRFEILMDWDSNIANTVVLESVEALCNKKPGPLLTPVQAIAASVVE